MLAALIIAAQLAVPLTVCEGNNMVLVEGSLNGRPCTMLFDTGATHTSFDENFVAEAMPEVKPVPVMLAGTSNAGFVPKIAMSRSLKVGAADFQGYPVMAIPFPPLSGKVGRPVHAILGMDIIGQMPVVLSLRDRRLIFNPDSLDGFGPELVFDRRDYDGSPKVLYRGADGDWVTALIDSGSSFSFVTRPQDWPAAAESVGVSATDVNGAGVAMAMRPGELGTLQLAAVDGSVVPLAFKPMINPAHPCAYIGSDTLADCDLYLALPSIRLRPRNDNPAKEGARQ